MSEEWRQTLLEHLQTQSDYHEGVDLETVTRLYETEIIEGVLTCHSCLASYPIEDGTPRLLPSDLRTSFGLGRGKQSETVVLNKLQDQISPVKDRGEEFVRSQKAIQSNYGYEWQVFSHKKTPWEKIYDETYIQEDAAFFKNKVGVDCGCGNGRYTMVPAGRGAEMVGIDLSNAILAAKEKGKDLPLFHPVQGDIYNLPFPDQQFDFAQTLGVIHITPDPEGALQSIKRTVKATGKIFIYVYRTFEEDSMMKQHALYVANLLRALTIKMSGNVLYLFLYLLIPPIFLLCYLPSMLFWHIPGGRRMFKNFPYNYEQYQNRSFRDIHMNLFDRFGNPIERRYTRREMMDWMEKSDFERFELKKGQGWTVTAINR